MTVLGPPLSSVASAHTSGLLLVLTRQSEACRPRRLILVAFVVSHAKWVVFEVGVWTVGKHVVNLHNGLLGGWKTKSSYGQVADVGITKGGRGNFDPWVRSFPFMERTQDYCRHSEGTSPCPRTNACSVHRKLKPTCQTPKALR